MIDHNDVTELKKVFDDRYVMQADCNEIQMKNNSRFANDDKRLEKQEEFAAGLKKLGWAVLGVLVSDAVIGLLSLIKTVV